MTDAARSASVGVVYEGRAVVQEESGGGVSHGCPGALPDGGGDRDGHPGSTVSPGERVDGAGPF